MIFKLQNWNIYFITTAFLFLSCIEKPIDPDFGESQYISNSIIEFTAIAADTSGNYWGLSTSNDTLMLLSADSINILHVISSYSFNNSVALINNPKGDAVIRANDQIMFVRNESGKITFYNVTKCNSDYVTSYYSVDSSGTIWFLNSENFHDYLCKWNANGFSKILLDTINDLNIYSQFTDAGDKIVFLGKKTCPGGKIRILSFDKTNNSFSINQYSTLKGNFSITHIVALDTIKFLIMYVYPGSIVKWQNGKIDTIQKGLEYPYLLGSISDTTISFISFISSPEQVITSGGNVLWTINHGELTKLTSGSLYTCNLSSQSISLFFNVQEMFFAYVPRSSKIIRIDNLNGLHTTDVTF